MANKLCLLLAALLTFAVPAYAETLSFPALSGRVVDAAHILPADQVAVLEDKLKAIEAGTGHQVVVATIADLQGHDIADYGYQLGRSWGIGAKGKNDGAIIILVPAVHKVRIEVGYGLEPIITDALSEVVISTRMVPLFKGGDYPGGLNAGVDALGNLLKLTPEEAAARTKVLRAQQAQDQAIGQGTAHFSSIIPIAFFLLFFLAPLLFRRQRYGGGLASGLGQVMLWNALGSSLSQGGSGGSSFGGNDDSFSGGGGSFGGGGASGDW